MTTPLRGASWTAVSSHPQAKKISLSEQDRLNREHAARHNIEIVIDFEVPGKSRNIVLFEDACERIEAYAQLRDAIKARSFDVLFYYDRSRLGRKASLSMAVVELCHEAGIITYEVDSPPATLGAASTDDMLLGAIKSVNAQIDVRKISEKHKFGMIGRLKAGEFPNIPAYGYMYIYDGDGSRSAAVDEAKAAIVLRIIDAYLRHGLGTREIAKELNEIGSTAPRGGPWQKHSVSMILKQIWRYAGWGEINLKSKRGRPYTRARGNWQPIITEDTAEAVQSEMLRRRTSRRSISSTYLFSTMVYCAVCGRRLLMSTSITNHATGRIKKHLRCYGDHDRRNIAENKIRRAVVFFLERIANDPDFRAGLLDDDSDDPATAETQIAELNEQIKRQRAALLRADDAWTAGTMDYERYRRQVSKINGDIEILEAEIGRLEDDAARRKDAGRRSDRIEDLAREGLGKLDEPDVKVANAWLKQRLRIWVQDNQVVEIEVL